VSDAVSAGAAAAPQPAQRTAAGDGEYGGGIRTCPDLPAAAGQHVQGTRSHVLLPAAGADGPQPTEQPPGGGQAAAATHAAALPDKDVIGYI
jgi:hypothetical protein